MPSSPKFIVGDTLVTATYDEDYGMFRVTDGEGEWLATLEQVNEHYVPVSDLADHQITVAESRQ